ncbi:monoglyceride lipase-like [Varroa jacobsoni]|uniref:monoglyceride lipase-like n=1 Tax=Varroa jacobsoni TaxID=62625 RepID=UPI000BFA25A6|nr:monoglyceride lipase-like [Varroa jacobsoni]XP_022711822.1 monoglyceride lipase-like [Varroa jacobsoni]XP_022711823.1 monoglyceride lipase-like [Varroa jacobsoni]
MGNKVSPRLEDVPPPPVEDSYQLHSEDKKRTIWCKQWKPNNIEKARCMLYICHGLGEHIMVYDELAKLFAQKYDAIVFGHDHVGHGRSSGEPRCYMESLNILEQDMAMHIDEVYKKYHTNQEKLPLFVFAHSMGGAVSLLYMIRRQVDQRYPGGLRGGLMLMGPLISLSQASLVLQAKQYITKIVRPILPSWVPVTQLPFEDCVSEPSVAEEFNRDPLRYHGWIHMGTACAMLDAIDEIHKGVKSFETPFFISHGSADKLCCVKASRKFAEDAPAKVKICKIYENGAHCLLHEFSSGIRERLLKDLFEWMDMRFKELQALAAPKKE